MTKATDESRRIGRVRCQNVRSSLGEVLDISGTGLRVRSRSRPPIREGQNFDLSLHVLGRDLTVGAHAVWVRKCGWRRWEMGIAFSRLGKDARNSLRDLARATTINESILPKRRKAG